MTIQELKKKWNHEKSSYEAKEVGTGVQIFVKDVLQCAEIFNLRRGLQSTSLERRRNEFIEEETKKGKHRADIIVFINQEIIIPIEVERHKNLNAGIEQIYRYQLVWEKQYGILTDGYSWRFYNNNEYREFTLEDLFKQTELFREFWREYIRPEKYYLSFFEKKSPQSLLTMVDTLQVEEFRLLFFDDITKLIKGFKNKLQIEGYLTEVDKKKKEKTAIEITYAYIIQFILYKTLVDNEFGQFKKEFEDRQSTIHNCLVSKQLGDILGIIDGISNQISKNIYRPFADEQNYINEKLWELIHKPKKEMHDVSPWLDIFVFIKKYNFSNVRNEIFGYIYENYLKELFEDVKKGQYFTDPAVVNFMLDEVGFDSAEIKNRIKNDPDGEHISIIDPACGSGTFLYSSVDRIINSASDGTVKMAKVIESTIDSNVFGLDIAEFPLYLAEMNILMRMLSLIVTEKYNNPIDKRIKVFKTKDSIAEFMDTALKNTLNDINVEYSKSKGQMSIFAQKLNLGYESFVRDEDDLREMKKSLENQEIPRRRFDFVVSNPPYVGYNDCAKQKLLSFEWIKKGEVKLNNIYGVNLHSVTDNRKKYRPNPNLYAFFLALGLALLKDNAKMSFIIPQTILTAGDLDVIRYHLAKYTTIEKIILFNCKMFIGRGIKQNKPIPTSSSILIIRKKAPGYHHKIEVIQTQAEEGNIDDIINDIKLRRKTISKQLLQKKLLNKFKNWNFISQEEKTILLSEEYERNSLDISLYFEHKSAEKAFKCRFYFDSGYDIDESKKLLKEPAGDYYFYPKLDKRYYTIKDFAGYWPNIRSGNSPHFIKLRQANQEYNLLDSKYKIIWSYANTDKFYYAETPVIWARNRYCAIGSDNRTEMLYLFALLNSKLNRLILEFNQKSKNEKDLLISTSAIKEFIRIPIIDDTIKGIKNEIIKYTDLLISLENKKLSDFIDFSKGTMQKYQDYHIEGDVLRLVRGGKVDSYPIKESASLIKTKLDKYFKQSGLLVFKEINIANLKNLPLVDSVKQKAIFDYITDLVFALYFNIPLTDIGFNKAEEIKARCEANQYYQTMNDSLLSE